MPRLQNNMKNKATLLLLLIAVIVAGFLAVLHIRNKSIVQELLIVKETNIGVVNLDSKKSFKISLTNLTGKDFEIGKVYTSCGCTRVIGEEAGTTAFIVKPGETTYVEFEFDPNSMHQKGDKIRHEAYFLTTKPVEKEYKVKIAGYVK